MRGTGKGQGKLKGMEKEYHDVDDGAESSD
jgi:hypothetical protein